MFLSGPCQRTKSLKSLSPYQINHVTWIQSQHHWSLIVLSVLLTPITSILNYSLQEGSFSSCFKTTQNENLMQRHVANLCRISYYHLRELRCRYLSHETAVKVANALVSSRLDYCNSLLYNTKKAYTGRLQRVQNALWFVNQMSQPSCTNYTGSPFTTVYCSNIISLLIKQYISANLHICPL